MKTNSFKSILAVVIMFIALVSCKKDAWEMRASNDKYNQSLNNTQAKNTAMLAKRTTGIIWPDTANVNTR